MRRRVMLAAGGVVALGAGAAAAIGFGGGDPREAPSSTPPLKTADVTRATLIDYEEFSGTLGYGAAVPLRYLAGAGVVTWLPPVGTTIERGKPLFKVDNQPVVLLYGELPLYRPMLPGISGPDVLQLEENLRALGHTTAPADQAYTSATSAAVKRWQRATGVEDTGSLAQGQVLYTPGAVRVADHRLRVGDAAGGDIIGYTGTERRVDVAIPVDQQQLATAGADVQVSLSGDTALAGKVRSVNTFATSAGSQNEGGGQAPAVNVVVSVADQAALGSLPGGPAKVRFVAQERRDVLSVPVTALVALAEGGYGVQVVEGSSTRYLAVQTGLFAGGRVEVRGGGLQPGVKVVVPK